MSKLMKVLAAIMLTVIVVCVAGCKKDPENGGNNNGGGNGGGDTPTTPTEEGMYLGIIGFNEQLYQKQISLLNNTTKATFKTFIENLQPADGTALYYADYTALKELQSYSEPPALSKVALVTFTDGLDNLSTSGNIMNPEGYGSIAAYRTALHNKITNDRVHGEPVTAYTIGLRGEDVQNNLTEFRTNLNMLASNENNVFEVTDMAEALNRFKEIAEDLYHSVTTVNLKLKLPGGLDDGLIIRFTFDDVTDGGNSAKYIQCTYKRTSDNGRRLENINYYGFNTGASSLKPVSQTETGTFHWFEFENLVHSNGNAITQYDINRLQLWKKQGAVWQRDSEFTPGSSSEVTETKNSALIMLVLDCTTSLSNDFGNMQEGARQFVEALCSSNVGGGSNSDYTPTVTTSNVTDINYNSAICGGIINNNGGSDITSRGVCWSTEQAPTLEDNYTIDGWGAGSFTSTITGLISETTYYIRAYAINNVGVSYGTQKTFTTTAFPLAPTGGINGLFTINNHEAVWFSKGNLQYIGSAGIPYWKFAENQWDYLGATTGQNSTSQNVDRDLFGWGTSGWDCGNIYYRPWDCASNDGSQYGPFGRNNLTGDYVNSDWGYFNAISNGGNQQHFWRTLTIEEWRFLFNYRETITGARFAFATVNDVNGIILLPDNWNGDHIIHNINTNASYSDNVITAIEWRNTFEAQGCVFLPEAGRRNDIWFDDSVGQYQSVSCADYSTSYTMAFYEGDLGSGIGFGYDNSRAGGYSVRLVRNVE